MSLDLLKSREVKNTEINPIQNKNKNENENKNKNKNAKVPSIFGFDSSTKVIDYNYREEIRKIEENSNN